MKNEEYKKQMNNAHIPPETINKLYAIAGEETAQEKIINVKFSHTRNFRAIVSIAACLVILISSVTAIALTQKDPIVIDTQILLNSNEKLTGNLQTFKSNSEFSDYVKKVKAFRNNDYDDVYYNYEGIPMTNAAAAMATTAAAAAEVYDTENFETVKSACSASTYVQEHGVDEGDTIKTFGNLIFLVHSSYYEEASTLKIFEVDNGMETLIYTLKPFGDDKDYYINEIYVNENRLVVTGTKMNMNFDYLYYNDVIVDEVDNNDTSEFYEETTSAIAVINDTTASPSKKKLTDENKAASVIYDISNPSVPKRLNIFEQSGIYTSSRLINGKLYLASSFTPNVSDDDDMYPRLYSNGTVEKLDVTNILYKKDEISSNFIVVSCVDINSINRIGNCKAIIGSAFDLYASSDSMFIYYIDWRSSTSRTVITEIKLQDGVEVGNSAGVNGWVDSRYSFAKRNGKLLVATTVEGLNGKEANALTILDEELKEFAKTEYFAYEESIKAVKYIGDYAYIITYEETDPLFVIDISDLSKPKILGNAIVSGFSTMLVDIGNNMLLGIGYSTGEYDYSDIEITDGVKLTLFSVKDPLNPKVIDEKEYKNMYSAAQDDPRAFVMNVEKGHYAFSMSDNYGSNSAVALIVTVKNGKIVEKLNETKAGIGGYNSRITYVDDWYYLVDSDANFASFELK